MHRLPAPALLLACLFAASPAAALDFWGTRAKTDTWNCPSFCTDVERGPTTGGEFVATAESTISDSRGSATAEVSLDAGGAIATPELAAEATSHPDSPFDEGSGHAEAFAVQGYTNVGGSNRTWTLDITLEGSIFKPSDSDAFIDVRLIAFAEENFYFSTDVSTLVSEIGATIIEETTLSILDEATTEVTGALTFDLDPGESVYVWALMRAEAERNGAWADALGTVTMEFDDPTGLEAAATVPEPAVTALVGIAALAIAGARRGR